MKLSNSFFYTIRENAKDEDSTSGNLLVRAGTVSYTHLDVYKRQRYCILFMYRSGFMYSTGCEK